MATRHPIPDVTGLDLQIERITAGVTQRTLALYYGATHQRIQWIEGRFRPTPSVIERYRAALAEAVAAGAIGNRV